MENSYWHQKFLLCISLGLGSCLTVQAAELFSYAAIQLPSQPQNTQPWAEIITTQEQWQAFYTRNFNGNPNAPLLTITAPSIDFSSYRVVVGGLGIKSNSNYSLTVNHIIEASNEIFMEVLDLGSGLSGQGCGGNALASFPYVAVLIRKTDKPITVKVLRAIKECS